MGTTKTEIFSEEENRIAELGKAFAHPARVAILRILASRNSCICGDIVDELPLSQATVSQHLKELKRIGIIDGSVEPPKVCYCINQKVWEEAKDIFFSLFGSISDKGCC